MKKRYAIENLSCAHCATKIEQKLIADPAYTQVILDFARKLLIVQSDGEVDDDVLQQKVENIEQGVVLVDKTVKVQETKKVKKRYPIENLSCAHCASKIEQSLNDDPMYSQVILDFNRKLLIVQGDVVDDAVLQQKVDNIESGVVLVTNPTASPVQHVHNEHGHHHAHEHDHGHSHDHGHDHGEGNQKIMLTRIVVAIGLFAVGIFMAEGMVRSIMLLSSYIIIGYDIMLRSVKNIGRGNVFDENFLMTIATIGACILGELPEAAAVMIFYQVGEYFQSMAVNHSRKSIEEKMDLRVDEVIVLDGNQRVIKKPEEVLVGEMIALLPGGKLALDGRVKRGRGNMQTASITGESTPRTVEEGDAVLSGFINGQSELIIEVTDTYANSTVSKIIEMVEEASAKKAKTETFITRFARYYTPVVVLLALLMAIIPPLLFAQPFNEWLYRGLVFLVLSCPCALVLSIPLGFFAGLGASAKNGMIVKGGLDIENLSRVNTIVLDKTGTLTEGNFSVSQTTALNGIDESQLISEVLFCESRSMHPIAKALTTSFDNEPLNEEITNYTEISGYGVKVETKNSVYFAGNAALMKKNNIAIPEDARAAATCVYLAKDNLLHGYVVLEDKIKATAAHSIKQLKAQGIHEFVLLSGDEQSSVDKVANELGIEKAYGHLLPQDKLAMIEKLKTEDSSRVIAFVGDGTNDAPVLVGADVGIAMGGVGTDAALEAADMMIMNDDVANIPVALQVSKRAMRIIRQNIFLVLGLKIAVLSLGFFGVASMWLAIIADVGVALVAVLNALRILKNNYIL